jgi:hypothetical protein
MKKYIAGAVVLMIIIGAVASGSSSNAGKPEPEQTAKSPGQIATERGDTGAKDSVDNSTTDSDGDGTFDTYDSEPNSKPKPTLTAGQRNAKESAESYLESSSFSKTGLIKQLTFEDFSRSDVRWAVAHVKVSWKQQAAKSAKSYLDSSSFSRSGLTEQLTFEGFTAEQAAYGVEKAYR